MRRIAQTIGAGAGVGACVFLCAAMIASPHGWSVGNTQDAWRCFWAAGACGVLAGMCAFWSIDE